MGDQDRCHPARLPRYLAPRLPGAVNLDSLFIDEGFGTLDPDTLAPVSETLHGLRVGGRMVGIITHIPELRDEFASR
jgi:exonuclease SbcC